MHYLSKLTPSHSCGHDNLSAMTLKCIANEICECLTLIINQTITTGIFPNQLKIAKVVPIFKKNAQTGVKIIGRFLYISDFYIFPHQILGTLYNSLIHPHFIYGLYICGFSPKRLTIL